MPRDGDPRVMVRLSPESYAAIKAAASSANVAVGALVRECAERYAVTVARDVAAGRVRLRRARAQESAPVVPARSLVPASSAALGRQARVNAMIEKGRKS